jgi:hypothetical protein
MREPRRNTLGWDTPWHPQHNQHATDDRGHGDGEMIGMQLACVVDLLETHNNRIAVATLGDSRDSTALLEPVLFRAHDAHHRATVNHIDGLRGEDTVSVFCSSGQSE